MSRPTRWIVSAVCALAMALVLVTAFGPLLHSHEGCPLETASGCAGCLVADLIVLVPPTVALRTPTLRAPQERPTPELRLPAGQPAGQPTARGPPAC